MKINLMGLTENERDLIVCALDLTFTILTNKKDGLQKAADLWGEMSEESIKEFDNLASQIANTDPSL
jgi:hypothetical protein